MKLGALVTASGIKTTLPPELLDTEVVEIAHDSRTVTPGTLFVAVRGFHSDGHHFIPDALRRGASAVVVEESRSGSARGAPVITVPDTRAALAYLSDAFFGHPSRRLKLVGITGTNGKTTTSYLARSIIEASGFMAGLMGTIDYRIGNQVYPALNTTPEAHDLQRLLAEMVDRGAGYCVMEVSSHALALGRTTGCVFEAGAFTNLTQDHLDFHESMESYFEAKRSLFTGLGPEQHAVINIDDPYATRMISSTGARVITTGCSDKADVHPSGTIRHDLEGLSFPVVTPAGAIDIDSSLVGAHNISNILTAIGIGTALGIPRNAIAKGIRNVRAIPGRMEKVVEGQDAGIIVDYAHTEDALVHLLEAVREVTTGRVITVFGCGGDRDRTKRPRMGAAAVQGSAMVIVTSDNPRTEDPFSIISEIEQGMKESGIRMEEGETSVATSLPALKTPYLVIPDRRRAINKAVAMAMPGDVVVIAGKGHEDYQILGEKKIHFDDREVARQALRNGRAKQ